MTTTQEPAPPTTPDEPEAPAESPAESPGEAPLPETPAHLPAVVQRSRHLLPGTDLGIIPAEKEMLAIAQLANTFAGSNLVPKALQQRPNDVFQVLLTARDLGVAITTAVREFHVIEGKVTLSPKVKTAMVRERAHEMGWRLYPAKGNSADTCTWYAERDGETFESTFTWHEAVVAGMAGRDCEALNHADVCVKAQPARSGNAVVCKSNWYAYPKRMLSWRALGYLMDDAFPEVGTGLYSPDELGAITDEDGNIIDLESVEVPAGMQPTARQQRATEPPPEMADVAVVADLRRRVAALPDAARPVLGEAWRNGLDGTHEGRYLRSLGKADGEAFLHATEVKRAVALVEHFEDRAKRGEWGDWTPPPALPADPTPGGDGDSSGAAADPPKGPVASSPVDAPPVGDVAGYPTPPPVTEPPPGTPTEPTATDTAPAPPGAAAAESGPAAGNPADCPVCAGTGILDGESCWGCEGGMNLPPCEFCHATDRIRHLVAGPVVRCIDQDACWAREKELDGDPRTPQVTDVESRDVTGELAADPDKPAECPLCHSARSHLIYVPLGHGQEGGMWRCTNASACKERAKGKSGVDIARAALGDQ